MTRADIETACCSDPDADERLQREAFAIAVAYYEQRPVAVGASAADLKHHQKRCAMHVRDALETRYGFGIIELGLIWRLVRLLWSAWSLWSDISQEN